LSAVCLLAAGVVASTLRAREFTLEWRHSVEKTQWEERYRVDGHRLILLSASIEAMGAGMEPPSEARLEGGRWTWEPKRALEELRLTRSPYARDYTICWERRCSLLSALAGGGNESVVTVRPC
jgi:hypothetical protein